MLAEPQNLLESYVKNSEVVMVFSGNELKESFVEKWQMLKRKIVKIQAFNNKSLLRGSKWINKKN